MEKLKAYAWPGNVRELRNIIERLVIRNRAASSRLPIFRVKSRVAAPRAQAAAEEPPRKSTADALYERMVETGDSFWTVVYDPFMARDLTREDLRVIVARGLEETRGSYKGLVELFNLSAHDYKRLLNFLRKYECRLPFQRFRAVPVNVSPPARGSGRAARRSRATSRRGQEPLTSQLVDGSVRGPVALAGGPDICWCRQRAVS